MCLGCFLKFVVFGGLLFFGCFAASDHFRSHLLFAATLPRKLLDPAKNLASILNMTFKCLLSFVKCLVHDFKMMFSLSVGVWFFGFEPFLRALKIESSTFWRPLVSFI